MAEYHVGCGLAGIYAGTFRKNKTDEWLNKSDVTNEAINAVVNYMYYKIPKGEDSLTFTFKLRDGGHVKLSVELSNKRPDLGE